MKKAIAILAILACALTSFAAGNRLNFNFHPYALQYTTSPVEEDDPILSIYGIGAEFSYSRSIVAGLYAEAGGQFDAFHMQNGRPAFISLIGYGGVGYRFMIGDDFDIYTHLDCGCDYLVFDGIQSFTTVARFGLGLEFGYGNDMMFRLGADGELGFCKSTDGFYLNYRIIPKIGFTHKF